MSPTEGEFANSRARRVRDRSLTNCAKHSLRRAAAALVRRKDPPSLLVDDNRGCTAQSFFSLIPERAC
jgi:hypothetical protein